LDEINPGTIRECRDFVKQYENVQGFEIHGMQRYEYAYIADKFDGSIEDWDLQHINVCNIDIEVGSENGFPEPQYASEQITAITLKMSTDGRFVVFGCEDFVNNRKDVVYHKCVNEIDLIKRFLDVWAGNYPDILIGWNIKLFDIPYLVNRIKNLLGEDVARKLSPWGVLSAREVNFGPGRQFNTYNLLGIANLDYIDLYQRYAPEGKSQESYKLDNIAHVELGERKLSYEEYGNLHSLYRNNYQLFIEYNIQDTELIERLDDKMKLVELALTLAYDNKTNYDDIFAQVRMWDVIIYNHLRHHNIIIPPTKHNEKEESYVGAHVKSPIIGFHNWIASFDLTSLYPHIIMQYNVSPEMLVDSSQWSENMQRIISSGVSVDSLLDEKIDTSGLDKDMVTLTPNGQFFSVREQGFLSVLMQNMYEDRSKYKKLMIEAQKELELIDKKDVESRRNKEKIISRYKNLQLGKKVSLNSAYGALGNPWFRFYDIRQAIAITTSGQLIIRWIEKALNNYLNKLLDTEQDYCIASDTDSIYLSLGELVRNTILKEKPDADVESIINYMDKICKLKIQPFITSSYEKLASYTNAYAQKMIMKREVLADKGIWTAKKRYVLNVHDSEGVRYSSPKIKIMGLEVVKSSTPSVCKEKLYEAIELIINKDENAVIDFIDDFREEFKKLNPEDIAFPRGVNGLQKYKSDKTIFGSGCPIHVRGSLLYNHYLKEMKLTKKYELIKEGEKIKFIFLKEPNMIRSNVIAFPNILPKELDLEKYIDYNEQFEKSFLEPLKLILDSIGWKTEHVSNLSAFFR
jgi:DNA polymerase elongation subunit (family B)